MESIIPLHFIPAREGESPADVSLVGDNENAVLVTEDNYDDLCEQGLDHLGRMTMWIMNSEREADVAADTVSSQGGSALSAETPLGEGVVLIVDEDVDADMIDMIDKRTDIQGKPNVVGSWEAPEAQVRDHLEAAAATLIRDRTLANTLHEAAKSMSPEGVQMLQVSLQHVPGAYVSFHDRSVLDFAEDFSEHGIDIAEEDLSALHASLANAPQREHDGYEQNEIDYEVFERILQSRAETKPDGP